MYTVRRWRMIYSLGESGRLIIPQPLFPFHGLSFPRTPLGDKVNLAPRFPRRLASPFIRQLAGKGGPRRNKFRATSVSPRPRWKGKRATDTALHPVKLIQSGSRSFVILWKSAFANSEKSDGDLEDFWVEPKTWRKIYNRVRTIKKNSIGN